MHDCCLRALSRAVSWRAPVALNLKPATTFTLHPKRRLTGLCNLQCSLPANVSAAYHILARQPAGLYWPAFAPQLRVQRILQAQDRLRCMCHSSRSMHSNPSAAATQFCEEPSLRWKSGIAWVPGADSVGAIGAAGIGLAIGGGEWSDF